MPRRAPRPPIFGSIDEPADSLSGSDEDVDEEEEDLDDYGWVSTWLDGIKIGYGRFAQHFSFAFNALGVEDATDLADIDDAVFAELEASLRARFDAKPLFLSKLRRVLWEGGAQGLTGMERSSSTVANAAIVQTPFAAAVRIDEPTPASEDSSEEPTSAASAATSEADAPCANCEATAAKDEIERVSREAASASEQEAAERIAEAVKAADARIAEMEEHATEIAEMAQVKNYAVEERARAAEGAALARVAVAETLGRAAKNAAVAVRMKEEAIRGMERATARRQQAHTAAAKAMAEAAAAREVRWIAAQRAAERQAARLAAKNEEDEWYATPEMEASGSNQAAARAAVEDSAAQVERAKREVRQAAEERQQAQTRAAMMHAAVDAASARAEKEARAVQQAIVERQEAQNAAARAAGEAAAAREARRAIELEAARMEMAAAERQRAQIEAAKTAEEAAVAREHAREARLAAEQEAAVKEAVRVEAAKAEAAVRVEAASKAVGLAESELRQVQTAAARMVSHVMSLDKADDFAVSAWLGDSPTLPRPGYQPPPRARMDDIRLDNYGAFVAIEGARAARDAYAALSESETSMRGNPLYRQHYVRQQELNTTTSGGNRATSRRSDALHQLQPLPGPRQPSAPSRGWPTNGPSAAATYRSPRNLHTYTRASQPHPPSTRRSDRAATPRRGSGSATAFTSPRATNPNL